MLMLVLGNFGVGKESELTLSLVFYIKDFRFISSRIWNDSQFFFFIKFLIRFFQIIFSDFSQIIHKKYYIFHEI